MSVIMGGWGVSTEIFKKHIPPHAVLMDGSEFAASLVSENALIEEWGRIAADRIMTLHPDPIDRLIGWSTGALIAWAASFYIPACRLILLSPTPSFCRRDSFRAGVRPQVLSAMREGLSLHREKTLSAFCENAGVSLSLMSNVSTGVLSAGLRFLENVDLRPLAPRDSVRISVLCGTGDAIIPVEASRIFADAVGVECREFGGGHGFLEELSSAFFRE